ncbi:MAG: sigma-54-dependent Fis family transcriptional regulator [Deltaproteobacteria bacterium]|nr:sigma-54-dependent Fis family transcriptional regulator [Deltaproteobacteria bacterium]
MSRLLVVDDEAKLLKLLRALFERAGHTVRASTRAEEAEELLAREVFDLLVTDVRLPGRSGLDLLKTARDLQPDLPVIVMSAYGTVDGAVEAMRLGAFHYLLKPFDLDGLRLAAERALESLSLRRENAYLRSRDPTSAPGRDLVARSRAMVEVVRLAEQVAPTKTTVLVLGESGVGKECVAEHIHRCSPRAGRSMIRVNCPAIPRDLLESELFGHVRGAFTGALDARKGKFEMADAGTLFLDEVGDLPLDHQGKLLGVLENQRFSRVGSSEDIHVDVRVIGATNQDLPALVTAGRFREDLYYRLAVFPIRVAPLRERTEDLPDLVEQLLKRIAFQIGRPSLSMDPALLDRLGAYPWPGNVRELRNVMERAAVLSPGPVIRSLPLEAVSASRPPVDSEDGDFQEAVDSFKVRRLVRVLEETGWCKQEAARRLGLSPRALSHYVRRYDLDRFRGHGGEPTPS